MSEADARAAIDAVHGRATVAERPVSASLPSLSSGLSDGHTSDDAVIGGVKWGEILRWYLTQQDLVSGEDFDKTKKLVSQVRHY